MELLTPGTGLLFWQIIIFLILLFILSKYAWKPITDSLKEREKFIEDSLESAKKAEEELVNIQNKFESLLVYHHHHTTTKERVCFVGILSFYSILN